MSTDGWSSPESGAIAALLRERTGLAFSDARKTAAEAVFRKAMVKAGAVSTDEYMGLLRRDGRVFDDLVGEVTVGETYFFREPPHFELVRSRLLPALMAARAPSHVIKLWSAGCASGEEAYSLAILCTEMGIAARTRVLATDISRLALARAHQACFSRWSLRGIDASRLNRWFQPRDGRYVLSKRIRRRVTFDYHNLADGGSPLLPVGVNGVDILFCRNVLIYFDNETAQRVGRRLLDSLAVGGWLLTGPSDPALSVGPGIRCSSTANGLIYQRTERDGLRASEATRSLPDDVFEIAGLGAGAPENIPLPAAGGGRSEASPPDGASMAARPTAPLLANGRRIEAPTAQRAEDDGAGDLGDRILALISAGERDKAERFAADAAGRHPASSELRFMHALTLIELGRYAEAANALRRVLYLDPALAMAQLALATVRWRLGEIARARAAYHAAHRLFVQYGEDDAVPLAEGARARDLASVARAQIDLLDMVNAR